MNSAESEFKYSFSNLNDQSARLFLKHGMHFPQGTGKSISFNLILF